MALAGFRRPVTRMQFILRNDLLANSVRPINDLQNKTVKLNDNSDLLIPNLNAQLRKA